jgi:DNA-binding CsgD family transcriptional regulator
VLAIGLGSVSIGIFIPYVFTLNNTEKIFAVVGSRILISLLLFLQMIFTDISLPEHLILIISFAILILALSLIILFKKSCISTEPELDSEESIDIPNRIYLTGLFNFLIIVLIKGVGHGIFHITMELTSMPLLIWHIIGGFFGCVVYIALYAASKKAFIWLANITFASIAMALLCNALVIQFPTMALVFSFLLGLGSIIGMINVYYIMGVIGKKYNSLRYLRFSFLFTVVIGGIVGILLGNYISDVNTPEISSLFSLIVTLIMLSFLIMSPLFVSSDIENDWAKDSHSMDIDNDPNSMFRKYNLSRREVEVCKLLLEGYTMRQISAMLSISYSTVNTYCTNSYRKLDINSKTELMLLFKDYLLKQ